MAEQPEVCTGLGIHEPLARDLSINLGNGPRKLIMDRICGSAEAVRAPNHIHCELCWEFRLDTVTLKNLFWLCNHNALRRGEILVIITPIRPSDTVTRTTRDIVQIFVICVAPAGLCFGIHGCDLWQAKAWSATDMAILACHLGVIEMSSLVLYRACTAFRHFVLLYRKLREHKTHGEHPLHLLWNMVHKPHHSLMTMGIAHTHVIVGHLFPMPLHLLNILVHCTAAILLRVNGSELRIGMRKKGAKNTSEISYTEVLTSLQVDSPSRS
jgi:hypothetical protein